MSGAIGYGTTLGIYNGATYVTVSEVYEISPPSFSRDAVEDTHMTSTSRHRTFVPGLIDAGEVTFGLNYAASASDTIIAALTASTAGSFRITFPNAVTATFSGVVTGYQPGTPLDDKMTATATIKVSGVVTWA